MPHIPRPIPATLSNSIARHALALVVVCLLAACSSKPRDTDNKDWAQAGSPPLPTVTAKDDEWKEGEVPPPPAFEEKKLLPIEMPPHFSLQYGIDPATITVSRDGIVRYVIVANNKAGGGTNAFYEGVRCETDEVKQYARFNQGTWHQVSNAEWKRFNTLNSRYAKELASQALCRGHSARLSVREMVQQLKNPIREVQ
jgi:hypothetical protein